MTDNTADAGSSETSGGRDWRQIASWVLVVLFCISLLLSVVAVWTRNQVVDTDRYVRTVAPLASDPAIQAELEERVADRLSTQLNQFVEFDQRIEADGLVAASLDVLVEVFVRDVTATIVESDAFPEIWEQMNRAAHPTVSAVLTGRESDVASVADGQITLDIEPLLVAVMDRLRERGFDVVDRVNLDQVNTTIVLFESERIERIQGVVDRIERLAVVMPIAAVVSLAAAYLLSRDRRRTSVAAGFGAAAAMAILLLALWLGRGWLLDSLAHSSNRDAAAAFVTIVTTYLRQAAWVLLVVGLVAGGVAMYMGRRTTEPEMNQASG